MDPELEDRIRQRAYDLWLESGEAEGTEMEFWLQAEREIKGAESEAPGIAPPDTTN